MQTREELIKKYGDPGALGQSKQEPSRSERWKAIDEQQIQQNAQRIQLKKEAQVSGRPWWQKAIDVVAPGAQFREAEQGESVMGDIKGGLIGAAKGVGSTIYGAGELGYKLIGKPIESAIAGKEYGEKSLKEMQEQRKIFEPKTSEEKTGFAIEQIAEFLIPASKITKAGRVAELATKAGMTGKAGLVTKVAPTLAKAGTEGGIVALQQAVQQGKIDEDTLRTGLYGALFPLAGRGISSAYSKIKSGIPILDKAKKVISGLDDGVTNYLSSADDAKKVLVRVPDKATREVVKQVATKRAIDLESNWQNYLKSAKAHADNISNPSVLDIGAKKVDDVIAKLNLGRQAVGKQKGELLQKLSGKRIEVAPTKFFDELDNLGVTFDDTGKITQSRGGVMAVRTADDVNILTEANKVLQELGTTNNLGEVDRAVDVLQDLVSYNEKVGTNTQRIVKGLIGDLQKTIDNATIGTGYKEANKLYGTYKGLQTELTKRSGYNPAVDTSRGGALLKQAITSPGGSGPTRELFKRINELTGVNLFDDAVLIKMAGEITNDSKVMSLLANTADFSGSIKNKFMMSLLNATKNKLANPEKIISNLLKKNVDNIKNVDSISGSIQKPKLGKMTTEAIKNIKPYTPPATSAIKKISQSAKSIGGEIISKGKQHLGGSWLRNFGVITGYGSSYWQAGLDVDAKKGDPVPAPFKGKVTGIIPVEKSGGFGNQVRIADGRGNELWISHLDKIGKIKQGQTIPAGTIIGAAGNTGNVIAGPGNDGTHLDLTMKRGGKYLTAKEVELYLEGLG